MQKMGQALARQRGIAFAGMTSKDHMAAHRGGVEPTEGRKAAYQQYGALYSQRHALEHLASLVPNQEEDGAHGHGNHYGHQHAARHAADHLGQSHVAMVPTQDAQMDRFKHYGDKYAGMHAADHLGAHGAAPTQERDTMHHYGHQHASKHSADHLGAHGAAPTQGRDELHHYGQQYAAMHSADHLGGSAMTGPTQERNEYHHYGAKYAGMHAADHLGAHGVAPTQEEDGAHGHGNHYGHQHAARHAADHFGADGAHMTQEEDGAHGHGNHYGHKYAAMHAADHFGADGAHMTQERNDYVHYGTKFANRHAKDHWGTANAMGVPKHHRPRVAYPNPTSTSRSPRARAGHALIHTARHAPPHYAVPMVSPRGSFHPYGGGMPIGMGPPGHQYFPPSPVAVQPGAGPHASQHHYLVPGYDNSKANEQAQLIADKQRAGTKLW